MSIKQRGFTLVEIAIVVPLMIIVLLALMGLLIALVNGISTPTKQNVLVSDGQKVFGAASSDVKASSGFLASVPSSDFNDSNSSDYSAGSITPNTEVLIIQGYNQVKDPTDTTGTKTLPAFKGSAPCDTNKDNIVPIVEIYFVKNGTLWRRVLTQTSPGAICNSPLLIKQTCPPSSSCNNEDTAIAKDSTTEFKVTYYSDTEGAGAAITYDKTAAKSVLLSIKGSTPSSDTTVNYSSSLHVSRINTE